MTATAFRQTEHDIADLFLQRWSPRAFTGEAIAEPALLAILDAARWAPSAYNAQPWHFVYARRDTPHWERLLGLLNDFNRSWAQRASALVIVLSRTTSTPPGGVTGPNPTHAFDTGAAWGYLALQASLSGWQAHGMAGFDRERARAELGVPADIEVLAAVAIGRPGDKSVLPEGLQARETPSGREPLASRVSEGRFGG